MIGVLALFACIVAWGAMAAIFPFLRVRTAAFAPTGLCVAAVTLAPRRRRLVYLSAVATSMFVLWSLAGEDAFEAGALTVAVVVEAAVFATVVDRFWPGMVRLKDRAAVLQLVVSTAVAVLAGGLAMGVLWAMSPGDLEGTILLRMGADAIGIMAVAPVVWLSPELRRLGLRRLLEVGLYAVLLALLSGAGFLDRGVLVYVFPYIPLAFLMFAVARLGSRGAAVLPLVLVPISVWFTLHGYGVFTKAGPSEVAGLLSVQLYGLTGCVGAWLTAALVTERAAAARATEAALTDVEQRVGQAAAEASRRARIAADVSAALGAAALDLTGTMRAIAAEVGGGMGGVCIVLRLSEDRTSLVPIAVHGVDADFEAATAAAFDPLTFENASGGLTAEAMATGRSVRRTGSVAEISDASRPELRDWVEAEGVREMIVAPMHSDGRLVGTLSLARRKGIRGSDDDVEFLQDLADRAGPALATAQLHAALEAESNHAQAILHAIQDGMVILDENRAVVEVNESFCSLTGFGREELLGCRPPLPWWRHGDPTEIKRDIQPVEGGGTPTVERVIRRRDGTLTDVIAQGSSLPQGPGRLPHTVTTYKDVTDRKRAEDQLRSHAMQARALAECSLAFQRLDVDDTHVVGEVAHRVARALDGGCIVFMPDGDSLQAVSVAHPVPRVAAMLEEMLAGRPQRPGESHTGRVFETGEPLLVPHIDSATYKAGMPPEAQALADHFARSTLAYMPLRTAAGTIGVMVLGRGSGDSPFGSHELGFLTDLAGRAAYAIENVRLHKREVDAHARARLLADLSHELGAAGNAAPSIAALAAEKLCGPLGDTCKLDLRSADGNYLECVGFAQDRAQGTAVLSRLHSDVGIEGEVLRSGEIVRAGPGEDTAPPEESESLVYREGCLVVVPLRADGDVVGTLLLARSGAVPYDDAEVAVVQEAADRIAIAMANARLHAEVEANEELFRSAFDNAPVGTALVEAGPEGFGRFLRVNPAFLRMSGYTAGMLSSMTPTDLAHPDDRGGDAEMQAALRRGDRGSFVGELRYLRADGTPIWACVHASPINAGKDSTFIAHVEDITERRQAEADLNYRALYDSLTGLPNRHLFMDHLRLALDQLNRNAGLVAVLFIDLDNFKDVNDSLGHEAGDHVLTAIGERLGAAVRAPDTASRLAGDEFVVLCPDVGDMANAAGLAERITASLNAPLTVDGRSLVVGASIGVATTHSHTFDPDELLRRADTAMYHAKRHGRNRYELYRDGFQHQALTRLAVREDLRHGLEQSWFRLHYQPLIDLEHNRIVGTEALLRLQHPTRGLLGPDAFIDVAEDCELIVPIGQWVLREACRQAALWQDRFGPLDMAVNISGRQASHIAVTDEVLDAAAAAGIDPRTLCLEMTERVLMDAGSSVVADLERLAGHGVHLAIDDFGTGYSSLTYLKRLPVDTVKIDRSFVADLGHDRHDTAIVGAIATLAHTLGLTIVAEGVETRTQLEHLTRLGCHRAQGFHFSRPHPPETIGRILEGLAGSSDGGGTAALAGLDRTLC